MGLRAGEYVTLLESAMIVTCADYGVKAFCRDTMHGCWTDKGKIGAVGTAVKSGGITKHGIAFNVNPEMRNFALIVPCGISAYPVTSLHELLGESIDLGEIEDRLVKHISQALINFPNSRL